MFCRKKVRIVALLFVFLFCLGIIQFYGRPQILLSLFKYVGSVPCRVPESTTMDTLRQVQTKCSSWPRHNIYFVSQGMLKRNRHSKCSKHCYLKSHDSLTAQLLGESDTPVRTPLLRIDCHNSNSKQCPPIHLLLPAIPSPRLGPEKPQLSSEDADEHWNVIVLGFGGLTHRLWSSAMPQTMDLFTSEMKGAIMTKFVPHSDNPADSLLELLRYKTSGSWITDVFREEGYLTQSGVLTHVTRKSNLPQPPSHFNLTSYITTRKSIATPGCVGSVAEGSILISWLREHMLLHHATNKVFSFLHLADLVFPSLQRVDAELVSFLLEYLHFEVYSRSALLLYSLPDYRSGFEPGMLLLHPPPRSLGSGQFGWDMVRSALAVGNFLTPADVNRLLAFLASRQRPSLLADIGWDARTCANLRISSPVCRCVGR